MLMSSFINRSGCPWELPSAWQSSPQVQVVAWFAEGGTEGFLHILHTMYKVVKTNGNSSRGRLNVVIVLCVCGTFLYFFSETCFFWSFIY